jgi:hypothetical protein
MLQINGQFTWKPAFISVRISNVIGRDLTTYLSERKIFSTQVADKYKTTFSKQFIFPHIVRLKTFTRGWLKVTCGFGPYTCTIIKAGNRRANVPQAFSYAYTSWLCLHSGIASEQQRRALRIARLVVVVIRKGIFRRLYRHHCADVTQKIFFCSK